MQPEPKTNTDDKQEKENQYPAKREMREKQETQRRVRRERR
jgi:hypothetical protein